jgi:hypothetical protein
MIFLLRFLWDEGDYMTLLVFGGCALGVVLAVPTVVVLAVMVGGGP